MDSFWENIDRNGAEHPQLATRCWLWLGSISGTGYGYVKYQGRSQGAHRVAWILSNPEEVLGSRHVMHRCDNRPCVNPAHLRAGTRSDNMQDCAKKGRIHTRHGAGNYKKTAPTTVRFFQELHEFVRDQAESHKHGQSGVVNDAVAFYKTYLEQEAKG